MEYDALRQQRLAGLVEDDYRGKLDEQVSQENNGVETELQEAIQKDIENLVTEKAEEKLSELRLRKHIRKEIKTMLQELDAGFDSDNWILSNQRKNTLSKDGQVTLSFLGPGFKK
jgi:DNA-binding TFAR19-related protein (PDSD5 family)